MNDWVLHGNKSEFTTTYKQYWNPWVDQRSPFVRRSRRNPVHSACRTHQAAQIICIYFEINRDKWQWKNKLQLTNLPSRSQPVHLHNVQQWQSSARQYTPRRIPRNRFAFSGADIAAMQPTGSHRWLYSLHQRSKINTKHKLNWISIVCSRVFQNTAMLFSGKRMNSIFVWKNLDRTLSSNTWTPHRWFGRATSTGRRKKSIIGRKTQIALARHN